MGERSDQIERDIASTRSELSDNFNELERKVKSAVDWRNQFEERPGTMLALAFGGGMLLSAILPTLPRSRKGYDGNSGRIDKEGYLTSNLGAGSGRSFSSQPNYSSGDYSSKDYSYSREYSSPSSSSYSRSSSDSKSTSQARRTLEALTGALASVAVNRASSYIDSFLPGFHQEFKKNKDTKSSQYPSGSYGGGSYNRDENYRSGSQSSYGSSGSSSSGSYSGSEDSSASRGDTYRSSGSQMSNSADVDRPKTFAAGAGASSEGSWPKTSTDLE